MNSLLELQRRMAKAVMQPLTPAEGMRRTTRRWPSDGGGGVGVYQA